MRYPQLLEKGKIIGICAPSGGVPEGLYHRLDNAISNIQALGFTCLETESVRHSCKCVSAPRDVRAAEFMRLYENPDVAVILPPWGGEFLMDMLPFLDFETLAKLPPKWVCGYSDITTLSFALTLCCDMATVHGANLMNMGCRQISDYDLAAFNVMSHSQSLQKSAEYYGTFSSWHDITQDAYLLGQASQWRALNEEATASFQGRMLGGCMDVICKLIGTRFAPVNTFIEKYKHDGFIWALESCEMTAADIYRTLWQMRESGWFRYCNGVLIGRADGYVDTFDFNLVDALTQALGALEIPVLFNVDIGHIPPQIQIVNGAFGEVTYSAGAASVFMDFRS